MNDFDLQGHNFHLKEEDVAQIENADELARFFAQLQYKVDDALDVNHAA